MPAIQPARLKIQIAQLVEQFEMPAEFVKRLNDLLFFYADRTRIPGRGGRKYSLTPSYNVPKQVFRYLEKNLRPVVSAQNEQALNLSDVLWQDNWLESRVLALMILGWVPPLPPGRIISRLEPWVKACKDDEPLLGALAVVFPACGRSPHWLLICLNPG